MAVLLVQHKNGAADKDGICWMRRFAAFAAKARKIGYHQCQEEQEEE
jgi:hypothetical protein